MAVATPDPQKAAAYYERVLGYRRGLVGERYVEMRTGPLRLFLTDVPVVQPTFEIAVDDVAVIRDYLCSEGFTTHEEREDRLRDPFGVEYCLVVK